MTHTPERAPYPRQVSLAELRFTAQQWSRLKEPICSLIIRATPRDHEDDRKFAWDLCHLLAIGLLDRPEASFDELLAGPAIHRYIDCLAADGESPSTISQTRARLDWLYDTHEYLPAKRRFRGEPFEIPVLENAAIKRIAFQVHQAPQETWEFVARSLLI